MELRLIRNIDLAHGCTDPDSNVTDDDGIQEYIRSLQAVNLHCSSVTHHSDTTPSTTIQYEIHESYEPFL